MSFRELVNENKAESTDREGKVNATQEPDIAEPRAIASGCYDQLAAGSDRLRTMRVASARYCSQFCIINGFKIGSRIRRWGLDETRPKKTMDADLPQDRRPCLYLSSPMEN